MHQNEFLCGLCDKFSVEIVVHVSMCVYVCVCVYLVFHSKVQCQSYRTYTFSKCALSNKLYNIFRTCVKLFL